jgi:ribosomal protein L37AE/L43A
VSAPRHECPECGRAVSDAQRRANGFGLCAPCERVYGKAPAECGPINPDDRERCRQLGPGNWS